MTIEKFPKFVAPAFNYGARYYFPEIGRFLSNDPAREFWNRYSYVGNNPVRLIDPTGNWSEKTKIIVPYETYKNEVIPPWRPLDNGGQGGGPFGVAFGAYANHLGGSIIKLRMHYALLIGKISAKEKELRAAGKTTQFIAEATSTVRNAAKEIVRNEGPLLTKYLVASRNALKYGSYSLKPINFKALAESQAEKIIASSQRMNPKFGKIGSFLKTFGNFLILAEIALEESPKGTGSYPAAGIFDPHLVDGTASETDFISIGTMLRFWFDKKIRIDEDIIVVLEGKEKKQKARRSDD